MVDQNLLTWAPLRGDVMQDLTEPTAVLGGSVGTISIIQRGSGSRSPQHLPHSRCFCCEPRQPPHGHILDVVTHSRDPVMILNQVPSHHYHCPCLSS